MATSPVARKARPHQRYNARDGTLLPGVTTVLSVINKPALVPWANRLGLEGIKSSEYVDELAAIGTLAHHLIECHLTAGSPDISGYTPDQVSLAENAVASFHAWARGKAVETRQTEWPLVSEAHRYGGTLDWYGLVDGVLSVIDFKTSSAIYDDHCYQLAGYHQLLTENGYEVAEARVLQVGRTEGEEFSERMLHGPDIEPYFAVFKAALSLCDAIRLATTERRAW